MPARRGQRLHLYRVGGRRLDTSHARRFAVWHWVNGQSAQGQLGTLHPAGSPAAGTRRAAWNH